MKKTNPREIKPAVLIRRLIRFKDLNITQFAEIVGVSPASVVMTLRRDTMTFKTFVKFMQALDEDVTLELRNMNKYTLKL